MTDPRIRKLQKECKHPVAYRDGEIRRCAVCGIRLKEEFQVETPYEEPQFPSSWGRAFR
jgi:hypothetical protein